METWELVDAQRKDNIALLEGLTPAQWDTPSLCDGWRVREVAAHLSSPANYEIGAFTRELLRSGLSFDKATARDAVRRGGRDTKELIDEYRGTIGKRRKPPGAKSVTVLNDMLVHGQDIRRPLGLTADIPEERLRTCLDYVKGMNFVFGAKKRVAGLKLEATDMDWTHGEGPVVRGTGEALLMILNGRTDALKDVHGEGTATLADRMQP
jgi:uncharacterized protein (TIGR03083 family)